MGNRTDMERTWTLIALINRKGCLQTRLCCIARHHSHDRFHCVPNVRFSSFLLELCARVCQGKFDRTRDQNFNPRGSSTTTIPWFLIKFGFVEDLLDIEGRWRQNCSFTRFDLEHLFKFLNSVRIKSILRRFQMLWLLSRSRVKW